MFTGSVKQVRILVNAADLANNSVRNSTPALFTCIDQITKQYDENNDEILDESSQSSDNDDIEHNDSDPNNVKCFKENICNSKDTRNEADSKSTIISETIFSTIDLLSGFWQIPIKEEDRKYTAFVTSSGLYQWNRMAFGLMNAGACFNRLLTRVLSGLTYEIALIYLDDIICFTGSFKSHLDALRLIFTRLKQAKLTLKASKCIFGRKRINFLGHTVSGKGIEPLQDKVKIIAEFPIPTRVKDVRCFIGMCSYFRKHIKSFSQVSSPLTDLTRQEKKFTWTQECDDAFQTLKNALINAPCLAYPDHSLDFVMHADTSGDAIGLVLSQIQNGVEKVISYSGKKLTNQERRWNVTERECYGVVTGFKHFDPYIRGSHVHIYTDHSALKYILNLNTPTGKIARWVAFMQQYSYTIEHRPAVMLRQADAISRIPVDKFPESGDKIERNDESFNNDLDDIMFPQDPVKLKANAAGIKFQGRRVRLKGKRTVPKPTPVFKYPDLIWTSERVQECQRKDPNCEPIISYLENGILPKKDSEARQILLTSDAYHIEKDILYHLLHSNFQVITRQTDELHVCLVVPKELIFDILTSGHGDATSGHFGHHRTYASLRLRYFWKGMYTDTKNFVLSCQNCNTGKKSYKTCNCRITAVKTGICGPKMGL